MIRFNDTIIITSYYELTFLDGIVNTLPFGHSRHFPLAFSISDKKIISGELNFFNTNLYKNFNPHHIISEKNYQIKLHKNKNSVIILNLLDNCFGHSLLKLFYSIKYINVHQNEFDFILIIPKTLEHFLIEKKGVNTITIDLKFAELEKCYVLNDVINQITEDYQHSFIAGVETYSTFNIDNLKNELHLLDNSEAQTLNKKIIFYYRADYWRKWCGNHQAKNIIRLFEFLKPFFKESVQFCIVGDKDSEKFPSWIGDYRTNSFSEDTDFKYNQLFQSSLLCIGLTGSHMLFPSLFSLCTVHLHPSFKYKNMAEDIIVNQDAHEMLSAYKHLYYFGNHNCSDIQPVKLGAMLLSHLSGLIEKEYKMNANLESQTEWIATRYPQFKYFEANTYRAKYNLKQNKKIQRTYYFDKLFSIFN